MGNVVKKCQKCGTDFMIPIEQLDAVLKEPRSSDKVFLCHGCSLRDLYAYLRDNKEKDLT